MNKIKVNRNIILDYEDEYIKISDGKIRFYLDNEYEIEYIDCSDIEIEFMIVNANVKIREYSFSNEINVKNIYNIKNGSLVVDKFYNNKRVCEEITFNLMGDGDKLTYNNRTISLGEEKYVINVNHLDKNTVSYIDNKSIALLNSMVDYVINSRVYKDCNKSILDQSTKIITIDKCHASVMPNMYIDLDDVSAKHGSVIGSFKEEQIFYLMSKGISYNDSIKLLIKGFLLSGVMFSPDKRMDIIKNIDMYWR